MDEEQKINDIEKALIALSSLVGTLKAKIAEAGIATKKADASVAEMESVKSDLRDRINGVNAFKNELIAREEAVKQRELAQKRIDNLVKLEQDIEYAKTVLDNDRRNFAKQCRIDRDVIATKIADVQEARKKVDEMRVALEEERRMLEADIKDFANQKASMDLPSLDKTEA